MSYDIITTLLNPVKLPHQEILFKRLYLHGLPIQVSLSDHASAFLQIRFLQFLLNAFGNGLYLHVMAHGNDMLDNLAADLVPVNLIHQALIQP